MFLSVSDDGVTFSTPKEFKPFDSSPGEEIRTARVSLDSVEGRYVRLDFRNTSEWTFLAEVVFAGTHSLDRAREEDR